MDNLEETKFKDNNERTLSWCKIGKINAAVLPDPVGAHAKSSLLWNKLKG